MLLLVQTVPSIVDPQALRAGIMLLIDFFLVALLFFVGFLGVTFGLFLRRSTNQKDTVILKLTEAETSSDSEMKSMKPASEPEHPAKKVS